MQRWIVASLLMSSVASAAPALPTHYAPLFEKGKTWVYDWKHVTFGPEDEKTGKPTHITERGKVTCKVVEVTRRAGVEVSHVTCDQDLGRKFLVAGYWVGTAKGLWRDLDDEDPDADTIANILKEPVQIAGKPTVFETVRHDEFFGKGHDRILIGVRESAKIHGWCAYEDTTNVDPDGGHVATCFAPGIGLESGYNDFGGSLDRLEFTVR